MTTPLTKKKFAFPSSKLLLFILIVVVTVATYIVPAGEYQYTVNEAGTTVVDASSYGYVQQRPVTLFRMFVAIAQGFIDGGQVIFLILFGYFWIYSIMRTGALNARISKLISGKEKSAKIFIPICILLWALAGSTYGELDTVWGLVPIFIAVAIAFGYDAIVGVCMCYGAVTVGFAAATTNPFTIGIAQSVAELKLFSGIGYRCIVFVVFVAVWTIITMSYGSKVKKDPTKSVVYGIDYSAFQIEPHQEGAFTGKQKVIVAGMALAIILIVVGSLVFGWYLNEMSAVFIIGGIVTSIIDKRSAENICDDLSTSFSQMMDAIVVVGLSRTILVIMKSGLIIDTVVYACASLMNGLPQWATAEMMLIFQNFLNFFIPSGSGQATAIMPIIVPLADLTGLSRQVAVLAYQFGDGYSNMLWPTASCAIAMGIAKIPLGKWYKFFLPVFGILFVMQSFFVILATFIHYV